MFVEVKVSLYTPDPVNLDPPASKSSYYVNTNNIVAVNQDFRESHVNMLVAYGPALTIAKDDWALLKKKIEADQRKQLR